MITAQEARRKLMENPSFERKTELYNLVAKRIEETVAARESKVYLNEEEHLALHEEMVNKGYKPADMSALIFAINKTHLYTF